jgi:hypothetical protein
MVFVVAVEISLLRDDVPSGSQPYEELYSLLVYLLVGM